MSNCESKCDCNAPGGYPHEPDCHWYEYCDEGRYCDKHRAEAEADHAYLKHVPRYEVFNDEEAQEQRRQDLRDGGHLDGEHMAELADMARDRLRDDLFDAAVISDERRNK